ncbi:LysR family transcriptional regulator [Parathalassolituus penaei]|uniref:LysR family transcriptional regulator n=1 Tax=Parathalassolituus penaei TaxID=2997323 RepID=A0A9X3IT84_9GAMM|nr:LysR family transcriptional regulator [Parathalassolituus penaei]MCY0967222.1 LysR family transcriptional regulator [Parathalassolituus penaei]
MPITVQKLASRLSFRQLQVFSRVYELRSYSKAGDELGLTQPAVSSQIRQIEETINQPLFEYVGRRLYTTAAAERLAATITVIFDQLESLQEDLSHLQGQVSGELNIAAVNTAQCVLPYLLRGFMNQYPLVSVNVRVVNRARAIQRLSDNADHLVVMGMVPSEKPFASLPFLDNELVPLVAPGHPLLRREDVTVEDFLASRLLIREPGSGTRLALEVHCQMSRQRLEPFMQIDSNDGLKHAVMAGLGVAVLPKLSVLAELQTGALRTLHLPGFPLRRSWCLVYPLSKHPNPVMRAFIDYVRANILNFEVFFRDMAGTPLANYP